MNIKNDLKNINSLFECTLYLKNNLKSFKTLYNKVYSDEGGKDFSKTIKAYQNENQYVVVVTDYENTQAKEIDVYLTNKKPKEPHPMFPITTSFAPNSTVYKFI